MAYRPYIWRKNNPEKRTEQKRREKIRRSLRDRGILPKVGEPMNEFQTLINDQISNNDFSYWDSIKNNTKPHNGGTQIKVDIKSPEYLLWYRTKSYSKDRGIHFDLSVEDIVIPKLCEITNQPISTNYSDRNSLNYYSILLEDRTKGYIKGNIKVVSVQATLMKHKFINPYHKEIYYRAKSNSKNRNLEFNLDPEDIIIPTHCPLLGVELTYDKNNISDNYYSIDRIDSTKGYIKGNVQIISKLANTMKNSATKEQLKTFAENIIKLIQ